MAAIKDLVEYLAKALVDEPEEVDVEEDGDVFTLHVAPDDRGRVIGKNGRTAHAIRTLMSVAASDDRSPTLDIVD